MKEGQLKSQASIAVLPFTNLSSSQENGYFCDGMTEDIINALAKLPEIRVISASSSSLFQDSEEDVSAIAEKLNVSLVLKGSVRLAGEMMRISIQLTEIESGALLRTETWDRKTSSVFETQDEISLLITDIIREHAGHIELEEHLVERLDANPKAYDLYLKGKHHAKKWNGEDVNKAIEYFEHAVGLDPKNINSHLGLSDAYSFLAVAGFAPREQAWMKSVEHVEIAKRIDANNPWLNYILANQKFFTEADFESAFKYANKAIAVKPNYAQGQHFLCFLYLIKGDFTASHKHLMYAKSIDPLNFETRFYEAYYYYKKEDFKTALALVGQLLAENPKSLPATIVFLFIQIAQGNFDLAQMELEQTAIEEISPDERLGLQCLIYAHKHKKRHQLLSSLEQNGEDPVAHHAHAYLFLTYAALGEYKSAFATFKKVFTFKSSVLFLYFDDPLAKDLVSQKEFRSIHEQAFPNVEIIESKKKKPSGLETAKAKALSEKLTEFVEDEQSFLNPSLNLRTLAADLMISANQLSWLLNEFMGVSFSEFINSRRIKHFKKLVVDEKNAHISIIGLAFESGFSSKTVFNTTFKKMEGITPKQYQLANSKK